MKSRVAFTILALTFVGLAFISTPAFAQGRSGGAPGAGGVQALASDLAALAARVAKLEGNIVAADLAGTYSAVILSTTLHGARPGTPPNPASIETEASRGSLTLNANGTGHVTLLGCGGGRLTQGSWAVTAAECDDDEPESDLTWTYADGVVTATFLSDGDTVPFTVALGGRLLILGFGDFFPGDPSSEQFVIILTRLK